MKALGCVLTVLSLIVALAVVWVGFIVTFQESQTPYFESTPREGWDYWMKKEFWNDLRGFTIYLLIAGCVFALPLMATLRLHRDVSGTTSTVWILLAVAFAFCALVLFALSNIRLRAASALAIAPAVLLPEGLSSGHPSAPAS